MRRSRREFATFTHLYTLNGRLARVVATVLLGLSCIFEFQPLVCSASTPPAPKITSIDGYTDPPNAASPVGVEHGLIEQSIGTSYNGTRVVNDQSGLYTWTVNGANFGNAVGSVTLYGHAVSVKSWSNTVIVIDPTGSQINSARPWDWGPLSTSLVVKTSTGQQVSVAVGIAPAIHSRVFGQCTWWVANRREQFGLSVSPSAYADNKSITSAWVPQKGDQVAWTVGGGKHQAIIESVAKTPNGNTTTYSILISQYNATGHNEYSPFTTSFAVVKQSNSQLAVSSLPQFSKNSGGAYSYYR